jgi:hypothetical protein
MASLTQEYKNAQEYKNFRAAILDMSPGLPEYLVDVAISVHISKPLLYRDKKAIRKDLLNKSKQVSGTEVLEGLVTIENVAV